MIWSIMGWGAAVILALLCLTVALRSFGLTRLRLRDRTLMLTKPMAWRGERFTRGMGLAAIGWGLAVLCAFFAVSVAYCAATRDSLSFNNLYRVWSHWDAGHYRELAEFGYRGYTDGEHLFLVFFPLYPWLVHLLGVLIPNYDLCGHLISGLCFLGSCYMLARLTTEEFGKPAAWLSLALFSAYPWSFFFAAYYTESLFMLLSLVTFYGIRRHRYLLAGFFGALAALTRMQGILLAVVAAVEYIATERPYRWRDLWRRALCIAIMGLGVLAYLGLNEAVEGDPFRFLVYQKENWAQGFATLPRCLGVIREYIVLRWGQKICYTTWIPELALFLVCLGAAVYGVRRLPPTWMAYFLLALMMNYSLSWPLSCGRYMASAFPLPVMLAAACQKRPALGHFLLVIGTIIQGAFLFAFLSGNAVY